MSGIFLNNLSKVSDLDPLRFIEMKFKKKYQLKHKILKVLRQMTQKDVRQK